MIKSERSSRFFDSKSFVSVSFSIASHKKCAINFRRETVNGNKLFEDTTHAYLFYTWSDKAFKGSVREKWKGVQA